MAFMNSLVFVMALLATSLGVHGVSLPTTARSLSGCGYQPTTERKTLYAGEDQQEVGFVDWTLSDAGVTVKYTITAECEPGTAHVELTESVLDPPIPGKFDCTIQGSGSSVAVVCGNEYLADLSCCSTKYLYTHLELTCGDEEETAFAGEEKCIGRRWCNYVKIDPPCDGCACDGKCLAKQTCPDGCDGDKRFCPADIKAGICTEKQTCPDGCNGADLFCPDKFEAECTKKVTCPQGCDGDVQLCPADCTEKVACGCGEDVCPNDTCLQKKECECGEDSFCPEDLSKCPEKVQCPGCEGVTACSLKACPLCCPPCFAPVVVNDGLTCEGIVDDTCNPCAGDGDKLCETLGGLPNSFKCCPPRSNCKDKILTNRLGAPKEERLVTFVCSSNCGAGCDEKNPNNEFSSGCALFSPIDLGDDGDPETDDIFNVCNDLTLN